MAAPIAYEQPTLNKAWEAFVAHIPTILIIWIATAILTALGIGAQLILTVLGNSVSGVSLGSAMDETVTVDRAFRALLQRPWRYLLAGLLFTVVSVVGLFLCILPGVAVFLVTPVYVNKIFTTDRPILDAFSSSFQAVYRSENGWTFVGIELLAGLVVVVVSICTCGLGLLVAPAVASFYVQNAAYRQGVLT